MKKLRYFPVIVMLGLLIFLTSSTEPVSNQNDFAGRRSAQFQRGMQRGLNNGMNLQLFSTLTQEQKDQLEKIRTSQMKKVLPLRNQINEKKARLRTLTTGDNIDTKAAEKVLAEIENLKTDIAKQRMRTRLDIRNVLTDEQKIMFDARSSMMGQKGKGFRGKGQGMKGRFGQGRPMPCAGQGRMPGNMGMRGLNGPGQKGIGQGMRGGQGMGMMAGKGMGPGMKVGMANGMMPGKGMGPGQGRGQGMFGPQIGMQGQPGIALMMNLTQEQQDKLKSLRLDEMKAMTQFRNKLNEYKAKLKTLTTGDNVNLKEVDKVIDQIGNVKLDMAKNRLSHRMEVRSLLNDDQKVMFDMHAMKGKGRRGKGMI
ncbi:MAG: periplasmic heavy metal sensor [Chlorobi bacterium]|nr:periplasmic heavy metal sensor [Chlorobiota bacterium]